MSFVIDVHLPTLIYINVIMLFCVLITHISILRWDSTLPGVPYWATGNIILAAGVILFIGRLLLPAFISVIIANTLIISGFYFMFLGTRIYRNKPLPPRNLSYMLLALFCMAFSYYTFMEDSFEVRIVIFSLANSYTCFLIARELSSDFTSFRPSETYLAMIFLGHGLFNFLRPVILYFARDNLLLMEGGGLSKILFFESILFLFAVTIGFVFLISTNLVDKLKKQAEVDHLTEAFNARALEKLAKKALSDTWRNNRIMSLISLDIDHFKTINDSFGHSAGDQALREFALTVNRITRPMDILGRIGGDEFIILLPETGKKEAFKVAERLRKTFEDHVFHHMGSVISFTVSIGVTSTSGKEIDFDNLCRRADMALYEAKRKGRNKVAFN